MWVMAKGTPKWIDVYTKSVIQQKGVKNAFPQE
jgi:hypothetical protein